MAHSERVYLRLEKAILPLYTNINSLHDPDCLCILWLPLIYHTLFQELDKLTQTYSLVDIPVIEQGCVDAVAVWFELQLDETTMISSSPEAESCWEQAIYHLESEDGQILDSVFLPRGKLVFAFSLFIQVVCS